MYIPLRFKGYSKFVQKIKTHFEFINPHNVAKWNTTPLRCIQADPFVNHMLDFNQSTCLTSVQLLY